MTHQPPDAPVRGDETPPKLAPLVQVAPLVKVAPLVRAERSAEDGRVALVIIDNPTARNGLTSASAAELGRLIRAADDNPEVRAIVLTGAGDHFCSGADLRHGAAIMKDGEAGIRRHLSDGFHVAVRALAGSSKPTLAVIRGACVGFGFDLALAADLRICAADAVFAQVFSKIGLVPDGGSSFHLSRLVGLGKAMELFLLGDRLSGEEAAAAGLVNRAVPKSGLDALAADWAERLASGPPIAFRLGKQNLRAGAADSTLDAALAREENAQVTCLQSRDAWTAVQAFFLKQKPEFKGQ